MPPTPTEAAQIIHAHLHTGSTEDCPLAAAHGRVLRKPIYADRPLPPFDRVTMDGYAVNSAAIRESSGGLRVTGFQAAGMIARTLPNGPNAIEIATGATLPFGADAIIPYEETNPVGEEVLLNDASTVTAGQNIHPKGSDHAAGAQLVAAGATLTGREIAAAASSGYARVVVGSRPSVAVIATGDELVEIDCRSISPQQIRKSNDYAIRAALLQTDLVSRVERIHLRDLKSEIESGLRQALSAFDMLVLTGGVSKGKLDHLPQAFADLDVTRHFHGVAQRPGKPMWFGTTSRQQPVFSLPGNPVSSYTCLHRYVMPALRKIVGQTPAATETVALAEPFHFPKPLAFFLPVRIRQTEDGRSLAHPAPFNTSGDLAGLVETDGFIELPADQSDFSAGYCAPLHRWTR